MKIKINYVFLIAFSILLIIEILIALFVKDNFIRPFVGDVLVVILLYSLLRIFISCASFTIAIGVFLFACLVEMSQFLNMARILGLQNNVIARIIIGSTFDWLDILAYGIGTVIIFIALFIRMKTNR